MTRFLCLLIAFTGMFAVAACGNGNTPTNGANTPDNTAGGGGGNGGGAPAKIIITAIPDDNADKLKEHFGAIAKYLEGKIGIPVEYMHVENYAASVTALANGQAHMSWMGGVTTVQADQKTEGGAVVVCCRDIDKKFKTYFIGNAEAGVRKVDDLKMMAEKGEGASFTFGSKGSTSGHLMPRYYFKKQSGKNPEDVFGSVSYSGSHDLTLEQVANGTHVAGALNYATYDKASQELKDKAPIIYTTPTYVDYSFVARKDLGDELIGKIRDALTSLDKSSDEGKKILGFMKAEKLVKAEMSEWDGIKAVMESGVDIGG
ncbi:MAG: phosphate/phosphite/phosphonate ABC transporter substrate-binding protein [Planctomycetes bacterium]|nr:phosphate/phosphite/phosphonate ABC transporter substrate-binding protein [Planctomycetota bacterium]